MVFNGTIKKISTLDIKFASRYMLMSLAILMDENGTDELSLSTTEIGIKINMCEKAVRNTLKTLIDEGLLIKTVNGHNSVGRLPSTYKFNF